MPRIAIVGSANMDLVVRCDTLPRPGETVIGEGFSKSPGGKGANQAAAAGRLSDNDTEVFFVGCVGDDEYGRALLEGLKESSVDITHIRVRPSTSTGVALIAVAESGENQIVIDPSANATLTANEVRESLGAISPDVSVVQLEIPLEAVYATEGFGRLVLNPAPAQLLDALFLSQVFVVTPNESETHTLTGMAMVNDLARQRAARSLLEKGIQNVVLTLGKDGVYWASQSEEAAFAAPLVECVVDTTGAGDAFNGALAIAIAEGKVMRDAVAFAQQCAAFSVTRRGAQDAMPWRSELATTE